MKNYYFTYRSPIAALLFFILAGGVYSLLNIQTGLFPEITFPKIKVIAENGQQPIEKMMVTVTVPLENAIKKVEDLQLLRSATSRGSCEISAFIDWKADVDLGKQRIEAQIAAIKENLPPDVSIRIEKMNPSILPVMGFSLEGKNRSLMELRQLAEYTIKPFLSRVAGVAEIAVIGGKTKEFHLILDPAKMSRLGITPERVKTVLSETNFIDANGYVADYNRLYLSLTDATVKDRATLENTILSNTDKRIIRLKDFAEIRIAEKKEYIRINANGKDVPLIAILKQPKANLIDVSDAMQKQLVELQKILPHDVQLKPYYNQADFVRSSIGSLRDVLWIGLLLALVMTVIFLRSFKASSVILITIPVTLGLSIAVMQMLGYTMNIMTIGAIAAAIGLIIDDAIVVVEQIHRTHEEHPEERSYDLVLKAIKYLFPAMVGSSLSTIVIFLPFVLMSGVAGAYFKVMTDSMIIILVCSFFVTWIGLPVVYILVTRKEDVAKIHVRHTKKRAWVYYVIQRPFIAIGFSAVLILACVFIIPRLPSGFLPEMDEGSIVLDYKSPPGSSLDDTVDMLKVVEDIIDHTPEVESYSRRSGTEMGFFITEQNKGDYLIQLKKKRDKSTDEVSDDIRKKIEAKLPFLRIDFGQVIGDMLGDLMSSVHPIEIKIFGDDHEHLKKIAEQVADIVEKTPGTADVFNGITIAGSEMVFEPDVSKLALYNLTPQDLHLQLETKVDGAVIGSIMERNQLTTLRMLEDMPYRSIENLRHTSLFLPDGKRKPIDEFASVRLTKGVAEIERENLKKMIAVTARLADRDLGSTLKELQQKISSAVSLPQGYQIVYGGAYAEQQQAFTELLFILFAAVFLVFTVILFLFRKIRVALAIMSISVLGIAGSVIALSLTNTALNVGSYTGIIMIIGIIGENSIFTYLQFREFFSASENFDESLVYSISTRLRPKLMTALGAIIALLPLALGGGTGAEMHKPLAVAIIGGLVFALPLLLVVLPTLLRIIERHSQTTFGDIV
jgi:CzcA family heavy metal efflux pump